MSNIVVLDGTKTFTPEQSLLQALENVDTFDQVAGTAVDKEGRIFCGWSDGSDLAILGMLELMRADVIERMQENKRLTD